MATIDFNETYLENGLITQKVLAYCGIEPVMILIKQKQNQKD